MTTDVISATATLDHLRRALAREPGATVAWDVVLAAAERFVWHLAGADQAAALRAVAVARATLVELCRDELERHTRALAHAATEAAEDAVVAAIANLPTIARWSRILDAAPLLTGTRRTRALRDALASAFEMPDAIHAGQAVAAVVARDPERLLEPAVAGAARWTDADSSATLVIELARMMPDDQLGAVLDLAARVESEWSRAEVLFTIWPRLAPALHDRWQAIAATIHDDGAVAGLEPIPAPPAVAPAEQPTLLAAINAWSALARRLVGTPASRAIADGVVRFVADQAAAS